MKTFGTLLVVLVASLVLGACLSAGVACLLSWAWGVALVPLGVPAISFLQAWCLLLVVGILTGGIRATAHTKATS